MIKPSRATSIAVALKTVAVSYMLIWTSGGNGDCNIKECSDGPLHCLWHWKRRPVLPQCHVNHFIQLVYCDCLRAVKGEACSDYSVVHCTYLQLLSNQRNFKNWANLLEVKDYSSLATPDISKMRFCSLDFEVPIIKNFHRNRRICLMPNVSINTNFPIRSYVPDIFFVFEFARLL
jgi:hypothetical protein